MEGLSHIGLPVLGILAVSVVTFYAVSFAEIREVRRNETTLHFLFFTRRNRIRLSSYITSCFAMCRNHLKICMNRRMEREQGSNLH